MRMATTTNVRKSDGFTFWRSNEKKFISSRVHKLALYVNLYALRRNFCLSHTIYAQVYPQVVRCNPPKNALSCTPTAKKALDVGIVVDEDRKVCRREKLASGHAKFGDRT